MLKIKYLGHACAIIASPKAKVIVDPWLSNTCNHNIFYQVPRVTQPTQKEIDEVTAIQISHIHSDHFCPDSLSRFSKDLPVIIHKHPDEVFKKQIERIGFQNIIEVPAAETIQLEDIALSIFPATNGYPYDSSLVVTHEGRSFLFDNDARFPTPHYFHLGKMFKKFEGVFVGYADIYPYPLIYDFSQCHSFEKASEVNSESLKLIEQQSWQRIENICHYLQPDWVFPYAAGLRFLHKDLLYFNKMFFSARGILTRDLSGSRPVDLAYGETVTQGILPPHATETSFKDVQISPLEPIDNGRVTIETIEERRSELISILKSSMERTAKRWTWQLPMKILFVIRSAQSDKAVSIGFAYSGTTFEGEVDIEVVSESGSAAFDIILTYGTGCILKLLNKEFSFPQLQYSYQYRTLIRRAVHSQMAVQYWG